MESDESFLKSTILGFRLSQVLHVFAKLGVADLLAEGPLPVPVLAERTGAHQESLHRVLHVGRAVGLLDEGPRDTFRLTGRGHLMRRDTEGSFWARACQTGESWQWDSWGGLLQAVTTGTSAFEATTGLNSFDYFDRSSGAGDTMMDRVSLEAKRRGREIAEVFDFSTTARLVDVGGGRGAVLAEILDRHRHLTGVLFDLPYAVAGAGALLEQADVLDRCEVVAGDFRTDLPADGDVCLLSAVLHSWSDEDAVALLRRCLARFQRVIVVDEVVDAGDAPLGVLLKDLQLMVFSGGRHRALEEYRVLFERAGGVLVRQAPIGERELLMEGAVDASRCLG